MVALTQGERLTEIAVLGVSLWQAPEIGRKRCYTTVLCMSEGGTNVTKRMSRFLVAMAFIALGCLTSGGAVQARVTHAMPKAPLKPSLSHFYSTAPGVYAHSWYVGNLDIAHNYQAMYNLGYSDGAYDNKTCTLSQIVLNFGQVDYNNGYYGGGYGYGTYYFNPGLGYPFVLDSQILAGAEHYVSGWYKATNSCPRLRIVLGVSNFRECLNSPCTTYNAGVAWGKTVGSLNSYVASKHMNGKIVDVDGGDDIETDVPSGWDTYSVTLGFVEGFNAGNSTQLFMDYGDVFPNSYWSYADLYNVAWGYGHDVPIPEVYGGGLLSSWTQFSQAYPNVYFYGVMTECASIPKSGYCQNPSGEYTPAIAWNALVGSIGRSKVGAFATNILYQV